MMHDDFKILSIGHALLVFQAADLGSRRMMQAIKYLRENWTASADLEAFITAVQERKAAERQHRV